MVGRDDRGAGGAADVGRAGDGGGVHVDAEQPGTEEHEQAVKRDPQEGAADEGHRLPADPLQRGLGPHVGDEHVEQGHGEGLAARDPARGGEGERHAEGRQQQDLPGRRGEHRLEDREHARGEAGSPGGAEGQGDEHEQAGHGGRAGLLSGGLGGLGQGGGATVGDPGEAREPARQAAARQEQGEPGDVDQVVRDDRQAELGARGAQPVCDRRHVARAPGPAAGESAVALPRVRSEQAAHDQQGERRAEHHPGGAHQHDQQPAPHDLDCAEHVHADQQQHQQDRQGDVGHHVVGGGLRRDEARVRVDDRQGVDRQEGREDLEDPPPGHALQPEEERRRGGQQGEDADGVGDGDEQGRPPRGEGSAGWAGAARSSASGCPDKSTRMNRLPGQVP